MTENQPPELRFIEFPPKSLVLTDQQQRVCEALREHSSEIWRFETWYLGALLAVRIQGSDYLAQAANSIREIAEKLPEFAGVPLPESPVNKTKIAIAKILKLKSEDYSNGWENRTINSKLAEALGLLENLQPIFDAPSRKKMLQTALERHDLHSNSLSPELRRIRDQQFTKLGEFFQNVTHHRYIPTLEEFLDKVSVFGDLILHYLTPITASQQTEIIKIIRSPPDLESESRLKSFLIHNSANQLFLLENLKDATWLQFLKEIGMFNQLREGEKTVEGFLVYRADPTLSCLARLSPKAPHETLAILKNLPKFSNPQIPDQIMRCLAGIEDVSLIPECLKLLKKLLNNPGQHDWIWIGEILKTWTKLECTSEIFGLISAYLRSQISRQEERYSGGTGWRFSEIDRDFIEPLSASHPFELARTFFDALRIWKNRQLALENPKLFEVEKVFTETAGPKESEPSTYWLESLKKRASHIYRLALINFDLVRRWKNRRLVLYSPKSTEVEDAFPQNVGPEDYDPPTYWLEDFKERASHIYGLEEILATRLYDIGSIIFASGDEILMNEFDAMLRSDSWQLFNRLRWQLYADYPKRTLGWARSDFLLRIPILGHYSGSHDYEIAQMLETQSLVQGFNFLTQAEIEQIYVMVMAGPIDDDGGRRSDKRLDEIFYLKQLHPIRSLLTEQALETYQHLANDKPEFPTSSYKPFSSGGAARIIEHVAPERAEHLAEMDDAELWEFCNTWRPGRNRHDSDQWWVEESVSALAHKFSKLLEENPERFQAGNYWWRNLTRLVILYKPLERATERISSEAEQTNELPPPSENDWRNWFGLAAWIADWGGETVRENRETKDTISPEDRDWNRPRIIAVRFLGATINPRFAVPANLKLEIGRLLRKFSEDPDPLLASKDKPMLEDWRTTAINSVRGTALENLLELAQNQKTTEQPEEWIWQVIRGALILEDQSPAIFAIVGARLNLVLYLYSDRLIQESGILMPETRKDCCHAFVLAHVRYGNCLGNLLKILPSFPNAALDCLVDFNFKHFTKQEQLVGDFGGRLGGHLAFHYWNDNFPSKEIATETILRYFEIADPIQRAKAIGDIASTFSGATPKNEHQPIYQRVSELWEQRFSMIEKKRDNDTYTAEEIHEELSAFIRWLGCTCLTFEWQHKHVLSAIQLLKRAPQAAFIMRTLKILSNSPEKIGPCTEILEALLSKESGIISWVYQDEEVKLILIQGIQCDDSLVRERTLRIQETLLRHGLSSYLNLNRSIEE